MSKKNEWKKREGVVYSTNEDFEYSVPQAEEPATLPPAQQKLVVFLDKSGRAGKQVTVVGGFTGTANDLDALARTLKTRCGVGGSVKSGEILIQGDLREKVLAILKSTGYRAVTR
jgi:translation initiation factor 1